MANTIEDRLQRLEKKTAGLCAQIEIMDPRKIVEFQGSTVKAIEALQDEVREGKRSNNRRITWAISIAGVALATFQLILKVYGG